MSEIKTVTIDELIPGNTYFDANPRHDIIWEYNDYVGLEYCSSGLFGVCTKSGREGYTFSLRDCNVKHYVNQKHYNDHQLFRSRQHAHLYNTVKQRYPDISLESALEIMNIIREIGKTELNSIIVLKMDLGKMALVILNDL